MQNSYHLKCMSWEWQQTWMEMPCMSWQYKMQMLSWTKRYCLCEDGLEDEKKKRETWHSSWRTMETTVSMTMRWLKFRRILTGSCVFAETCERLGEIMNTQVWVKRIKKYFNRKTLDRNVKRVCTQTDITSHGQVFARYLEALDSAIASRSTF
jgi:hypothetical protein